jgi:hypothetical protein
MRRSIGMTIYIGVVLLIMIGLNRARYVNLDRPTESEEAPNRSSYNSGPTGTRAIYQLLEEENRLVGRWRLSWHELEKRAPGSILILVGPLSSSQSATPNQEEPDQRELDALATWVDNGGQLVVIGRSIPIRLPGPPLPVTSPLRTNDARSPASDERSGTLFYEPTRLTRHLGKIVLSRYATRIDLTPTEQAEEPAEESAGPLTGAITHLGDGAGAILVDFEFGGGRVVFLTDPFLIANNGIGQGANLQLVLNLIDELTGESSGRPRQILFDEYHHGFRDDRNPLLTWMKGTPWPFIGLQALLLGLLIIYSQSRRFTRPLPLQRVDRHSSLEFVSSMANLQRTAAARDLAIENIYSRFRGRLGRRLGVPASAAPAALAARLAQERISLSSPTTDQTLNDCEAVLAGTSITDQQLINIVANLRQIEESLNHPPFEKRVEEQARNERQGGEGRP